MYLEKFEKTINSHGLIVKGDKLLIALSGGSDSVAMLLLLCQYTKKHPELELSLEALHFNHMIRGVEADEDQEFCKDLCSKLEIKLSVVSEDIPKLSKEMKKSLEETARDQRYKALQTKALEMGEGTKIVVAHNKNDREETIFFNIARGTSIDGLRGIRYSNKNIIRPLLDISKEETYEICRESGVSFRTDKTNFETDATRNKIRLKILPEISETLGVNIGDKLGILGDFAEIDGDYIKEEAEKAFYEAQIEKNVFDVNKILSFHRAISTRVVKLAISDIIVKDMYPFKDGTNVTKVMIERVLEFASSGENSKTIELGKDAFVNKRNGKLKFFGKKHNTKKEITVLTEDVPKEKLKEKMIECKGSKEMAVLFDKDELLRLCNGNLPEVRNPKIGDEIALFGGTGTKKIRRLLIDNKIENEDKSSVVVLAFGDKVFHIFGLRRSKFATIQENTKCGIIYKLIT